MPFYRPNFCLENMVCLSKAEPGWASLTSGCLLRQSRLLPVPNRALSYRVAMKVCYSASMLTVAFLTWHLVVAIGWSSGHVSSLAPPFFTLMEGVGLPLLFPCTFVLYSCIGNIRASRRTLYSSSLFLPTQALDLLLMPTSHVKCYVKSLGLLLEPSTANS